MRRIVGAEQFGIAAVRELSAFVGRRSLRLNMDTEDFDQRHTSYKQASDHWVEAIRAEEALASTDHSMKEMER